MLTISSTGKKKPPGKYRNKRQNLCLLANSLNEEKGGGRANQAN